MNEWIWKVQNTFNLKEAVTVPLKEQWIFSHSRKGLPISQIE